MAISGAPLTSRSLGQSTELTDMLSVTQNALEIFPSEGVRHSSTPVISNRPPRSGVVMRVGPISRGAVWALAAIVLAGAGSVAAIGLLLVGRAR